MTAQLEKIEMIPVSKIVAGDNDRRTFEQTALEMLAGDILCNGLLNPPLVRPMADGTYQIVAGERRTRAMRDCLGMDEIPCFVRTMTDSQASSAMLAENLLRVDLNPIEEAQAFAKRMEADRQAGISETDSLKALSAIVGRSAGLIQKRVSLLSLAPEISDLVRVGQFAVSYAEKITSLDKNRQRIAVRLYNKASSMPMYRWLEIIGELTTQQTQENAPTLFALEMTLESEIVASNDKPAKGRKARTGARANRALPPVTLSANEKSIARILDGYISDLQNAGESHAASAIANVYNVLVAHGLVSVPHDVQLPSLDTARAIGTVADNLHEKLTG